MPRSARINAPGALHHIIVRGIGRRKIFDNDEDRNEFLERLGAVLNDTDTGCFAWALIPNNLHLLLRTGQVPMSTVMRRLLTGYAMNYNRRQYRSGSLADRTGVAKIRGSDHLCEKIFPKSAKTWKISKNMEILSLMISIQKAFTTESIRISPDYIFLPPIG